jgi:hypothetical protein
MNFIRGGKQAIGAIQGDAIVIFSTTNFPIAVRPIRTTGDFGIHHIFNKQFDMKHI